MEPYTVFPDKTIRTSGPIADTFKGLGITTLWEACRYVQDLPYGYNSDRYDLMILFKEKMGSCTTKHAVIATLAAELETAIEKSIGIYPMTEALVTGTGRILGKYRLPYLPMVHCFLEYQDHRVDLSEGNRNGKNGPIDDFLHTERVVPNISARDEYRLYRTALAEHILPLPELRHAEVKTILKAREEGLILLRENIQQ
ncbi:MAG: hypothetical protein LJE65_16120 [Desulfobacteraceae bacterium]|jgi:hypothetical protein|nr:hypothetical protein [Desulfobacteraceae bacterium]